MNDDGRRNDSTHLQVFHFQNDLAVPVKSEVVDRDETAVVILHAQVLNHAARWVYQRHRRQ